MIGQIIGNYRIESLLGAGGMGQVYRAAHVHLGRIAAVKVMHANLSDDPGFRARFLQEAKAAAVLDHPNIVEIYDFGEQEGHFYLVMELAASGSVRNLMKPTPETGQRVPLPLSLNLILQAATGLAFAHDKGMVHRDIKPDNLLLQPASGLSQTQPGYVVKLSDFGLARLAEDGVKTSAGQVLGTPAYMSPEQVKSEALDGRSDIYSLGVVLYELVIGRRPFEANTLSQAAYQHVFVPPPPPRTLESGLPPLIEEIILRCLAKQPHDRYATALELIGDLSRTARGVPVESHTVTGASRGDSPATLAAASPQVAASLQVSAPEIVTPTGAEGAPVTVATEIAQRPPEMKSPGPDAVQTEPITLIESATSASKQAPVEARDIPAAGSDRARPSGREAPPRNRRWPWLLFALLGICLVGAVYGLAQSGPWLQQLPVLKSIFARLTPVSTPTAATTPTATATLLPSSTPTSTSTTVSEGVVVAATVTAEWLKQDSDGDGLSNKRELVMDTDPLRRDTDGDGVEDLADPYPLFTPTFTITPEPIMASTATPTPTAAPTFAPIPTCIVTNPTLNVRSGPGIAYNPPIAVLNKGTSVHPLAFMPNGFPSGAWLQVEITGTEEVGWVSLSYIDCGSLDVTQLPGGQIPPTPTPTSTPKAPPPSGPYDYRADRAQIKPGECTYLRWNIQGVRGVYLNNEGVAGVDMRWVCPTVTTTYTLRVVRTDGSQVQQAVTIGVAGQTPTVIINVTADHQRVARGGCTTLRWNIQGVRAVYLNGAGVAGVNNMRVCLQGTTTYTWRILLPDGSETTRQVTVTVS